MTVQELIDVLRGYPPGLEVLYLRYSDYAHLEADQLQVVQAVDQDSYVMRAYPKQIPTMSVLERARVKDYLLFPGN